MKQIITGMVLACSVIAACAQPEQKLYSEDLLAEATVVLRVKWLKDQGADKYAWQEVQVLQTLKNESSHQFSGKTSIAHLSGNDGIPHSTCTVYLQRYNSEKDDLWKLLGSTANKGVSHIADE